MTYLNKLLAVLLLVAMLVGCLAACDGGEDPGTEPGTNEGDAGNNGNNSTGEGDEPAEFVDIVGTLKFDPNSDRVHTEATVKLHIDGDTTHFNVSKDIAPTGVLKARYLAVNTPESTGQIEPWGKKASNYTKNVLANATEIILESDDGRWNLDSTGERHLVWVWYKAAGSNDFRNLNIELIQQGLAYASNASDNCYGETCSMALSQSIAHKLNVFSKEKDPDFFYGNAIPITLKELKTNADYYEYKRVSFEGVVAKESDNTVYIEEYDEITGMYYGIQVYYGFSLGYYGDEILNEGNRVMIVGKVTYYEAGGVYQVSDIFYHAMRPDHEDNIQLISSGHEAAYTEVSGNTLLNGKVTVDTVEYDEAGEPTEVPKEFDYGFLALHSSASMKNLVIKSIYTTDNDGANDGALSITCTAEDGTTVVLRTGVLSDADGNIITADAFPIGSTINAKGTIDVYNGKYQLHIYSANDITIVSEAN